MRGGDNRMIVFELKGQIRGGKNHVQITRTGHRYPNPAFVEWRDGAIAQIRQQHVFNHYGVDRTIKTPAHVTVRYWSGDKRRRDVPAMIDALWHVLERGGFVEDDALLENVFWTHMGYDKTNPRIQVVMEVLA